MIEDKATKNKMPQKISTSNRHTRTARHTTNARRIKEVPNYKNKTITWATSIAKRRASVLSFVTFSQKRLLSNHHCMSVTSWQWIYRKKKTFHIQNCVKLAFCMWTFDGTVRVCVYCVTRNTMDLTSWWLYTSMQNLHIILGASCCRNSNKKTTLSLQTVFIIRV